MSRVRWTLSAPVEVSPYIGPNITFSDNRDKEDDISIIIYLCSHLSPIHPGNHDAFYMGIQMILSRLEADPDIDIKSMRYAGASAGGQMPFEVALRGEHHTLLTHLSYGVLSSDNPNWYRYSYPLARTGIPHRHHLIFLCLVLRSSRPSYSSITGDY